MQMTEFWFGNQISPIPKPLSASHQPTPSLINLKNHEVMVKIKALKLAAYVEELVKEEFPLSSTSGGLALSSDGCDHQTGGIDYELCLHQDFLFMLR